ncbi:MAG: T9SS type A sorting domain-containing protein [Bacteroidota bacterium]
MKKVLLALLIIISNQTYSQTLIPSADEILLPKFMVNGTTAASRMQYLCRLRLTGLLPNATYRYFTGASTNAALATTATSPGNMFGINNNFSQLGGNIVGYTSNKTLGGTLLSGNENVTVGRYSELTTDANGSYIGWFAIVPTGNVVFTVGNDVYFYVQVNNGAGGITVAQNFRTTNTIKVINYGTTSQGANQGSALRGNSFASPESFIFGYDTITSRPVFGTWIERDSIFINHTTWYNITGQNGIDSVNGAWGAVIPNNLPLGITRIESRDINNSVLFTNNSPSGIWGTTSTVNPAGGTTPLVISSNDAPLPVRYKSFTSTRANNSNLLKWTTATETNNSGFEVQRSVNNGKYEVIGFVKGAGNSRQLRNYSFTDAAKLIGNVCYRLRQIDFNGNSEISKSTCVNISEEKITTEVLPTPNPFNNSLQINYATATEGNAHIEVVDMLGKVQLQTNEHVNKGANSIHLNTETLPLGIYFLRVSQGGEVLTKRIVKK